MPPPLHELQDPFNSLDNWIASGWNASGQDPAAVPTINVNKVRFSTNGSTTQSRSRLVSKIAYDAASSFAHVRTDVPANAGDGGTVHHLLYLMDTPPDAAGAIVGNGVYIRYSPANLSLLGGVITNGVGTETGIFQTSIGSGPSQKRWLRIRQEDTGWRFGAAPDSGNGHGAFTESSLIPTPGGMNINAVYVILQQHYSVGAGTFHMDGFNTIADSASSFAVLRRRLLLRSAA